MPSISGIFGRLRKPTAVTTAFAGWRPGPPGPSVPIAPTRPDDRHREALQPVLRRWSLPLEASHPRIEGELLETELELLLVDLLAEGEAQALRQSLLGADAEQAGARDAIVVEEVDR